MSLIHHVYLSLEEGLGSKKLNMTQSSSYSIKTPTFACSIIILIVPTLSNVLGGMPKSIFRIINTSNTNFTAQHYLVIPSPFCY